MSERDELVFFCFSDLLLLIQITTISPGSVVALSTLQSAMLQCDSQLLNLPLNITVSKSYTSEIYNILSAGNQKVSKLRQN